MQQQQSFGTYVQSSVYSRGDEAGSQPTSATIPRQQVEFTSAAPLPKAAVERLQSMATIDRESLRPGNAVATPHTASRFTGYAPQQQQQQPSRIAAFTSPAREAFRRPTSPGVSWMNRDIPRFRYEPPPMIPSYIDIDRQASTPAKERRGDDNVRQRIPQEDRWGVPVRRIPNRFNSIPSDSRESEFDTNDDREGYASRRQTRDETPRSRRSERRSTSNYGSIADTVEPYADRRSHSRRHDEGNMVVTPRDNHNGRPRRSHNDFEESAPGSRSGTPRRAGEERQPRHYYGDSHEERQLIRDEEERRQRRRERRHQREEAEDFVSPVRERSSHRSSRHQRREDIDNTMMSDEYRAVDDRAERHRRRAARHDEDVQSPESYVVGSTKLGKLVVDVEPVRRASSPSSSRRRGDESEEQYRARRRAEREQRRMLAR